MCIPCKVYLHWIIQYINFKSLFFFLFPSPSLCIWKKNRKYSLYETKLCDSVVQALLWPPSWPKAKKTTHTIATDHHPFHKVWRVIFITYSRIFLNFYLYLQVSWIRKRDLHIVTAGTVVFSSDERFQVTFLRKHSSFEHLLCTHINIVVFWGETVITEHGKMCRFTWNRIRSPRMGMRILVQVHYFAFFSFVHILLLSSFLFFVLLKTFYGCSCESEESKWRHYDWKKPLWRSALVFFPSVSSCW